MALAEYFNQPSQEAIDELKKAREDLRISLIPCQSSKCHPIRFSLVLYYYEDRQALSTHPYLFSLFR